MTIAWAALKTAIHGWIVTGSGLAAARVIWARQPAPRPQPPYITIGATVVPRGQPWKTVEDNPTPTPGSEIVLGLHGERELILSLQCFDTSDPFGPASGAAILEGVVSSQRTLAVHAALRAGGLGVTRFGTVTPIDTGSLGQARFEPRHILEIRGLISSEVEEFTTYLEAVEVEDEARSDTFIVDSTP